MLSLVEDGFVITGASRYLISTLFGASVMNPSGSGVYLNFLFIIVVLSEIQS